MLFLVNHVKQRCSHPSFIFDYDCMDSPGPGFIPGCLYNPVPGEKTGSDGGMCPLLFSLTANTCLLRTANTLFSNIILAKDTIIPKQPKYITCIGCRSAAALNRPHQIQWPGWLKYVHMVYERNMSLDQQRSSVDPVWTAMLMHICSVFTVSTWTFLCIVFQCFYTVKERLNQCEQNTVSLTQKTYDLSSDIRGCLSTVSILR